MSRRIAIVEDEPAIRANYADALRRHGYEVAAYASRPEAIDRLFLAGLDSIRVSLNSAREELYRAYFRPRGYGFESIVESLRLARRHRFLTVRRAHRIRSIRSTGARI